MQAAGADPGRQALIRPDQQDEPPPTAYGGQSLPHRHGIGPAEGAIDYPRSPRQPRGHPDRAGAPVGIRDEEQRWQPTDWGVTRGRGAP